MDDILRSEKTKRPIWTFIQCFSLIFISLCAVAINIDDLLIFFIAMLSLIVIPCLLISVISLIYNIRFNTKQKRIFVIWNFINFCLLAYPFVSNLGCEACKMSENYEKHKDAFNECQAILNKKLKSGYQFYYISGRFTEIGSYNGKDWLENRDNQDLSNDSILANVGLNNEDLKEIKNMLKSTNCIGIRIHSADEMDFVYKQQGFGMYSYQIFNQDLSDSELDSLSNLCNFVPVTDRVVLKYEAGATGNLCFQRCDKHDQ